MSEEIKPAPVEEKKEEWTIVSKNEKRNMMMVICNGKTMHVPINNSKAINPQTGSKHPKGGKKNDQKNKKKPTEDAPVNKEKIVKKETKPNV